MKKITSTLCLIGVLLILGAGCRFGSNPQEPTTTTTPTIDTTLQQEAYLFCTQKGYDIQIRFVAAQNRNIAYCVFDEDHECESIDFMQDKCSDKPENTEDEISSMFEPIPGDKFPLRLCDPVANPVCGVDNKTYTNGCVAEFLGVKISHAGTCGGSTGPAILEESIASDSGSQERIIRPHKPVFTEEESVYSSQNTTPGTTSNATTNTWVEIPLSLLQSTAGTDSRIDRCNYGGEVTFYVHGEFPTLYNAKGEAICYPQHDINNTCPSYITNGAYSTSCTRVSK